MTMTHPEEHLPRPAAALDQLADYYDTHDTSADMEGGEWVEPGPMVTTSLRLPADVINELKRQAQARHVRYTTYIRAILERAASGSPSVELSDITERLKRIERAVTRDHKTA
jgi:CopG antitoxin of type II toxin-antitoxin system